MVRKLRDHLDVLMHAFDASLREHRAHHRSSFLRERPGKPSRCDRRPCEYAWNGRFGSSEGRGTCVVSEAASWGGVGSKQRKRPYRQISIGKLEHAIYLLHAPDQGRNLLARYRLFEAPRKPELTETQKTLARKRQELGRVLERLRLPGLTPGMARELRKNAANLEREIAEIERA